MSDLTERARKSLGEGDYIDSRVSALCALADSVEQLVATIKEQAGTEHTIQLGEVLSGPAIGDPVGYLVVETMNNGTQRVVLDYLEEEPHHAAACVGTSAERVVAVYDLPKEVGSDD